MDLPDNNSQLTTQAGRSARPVKLAVILVIICAFIPYITVIIVNWQHSFATGTATLFFAIIICLTFIPLVLTYFRFKNAYKECYSKQSCPTDILKYIDKQRRIFVIINICRSILLLGFLPEFPLYSFFRYTFNEALNEYEAEPRTEQNANNGVAFVFFASIVMIAMIIIFNAFMDLCIFRQRFGKLCNPDSCLRCGNTIEVDVTNLYCLYCRACEKLRKEVEKAHFLPNPQQKTLITYNTRLLNWTRDYMKYKNTATVLIASIVYFAFFYLLHWIFFDIALAKMAGPKMCPWCACRPIVMRLECGEKRRECSKEDEIRRQFESCEECLRM
ncbi:hypothetical protein DdX_16286 [Ditylenchus destructor]|uniref:Uncharacterized protein n=1 Tax=Ditylenchus destructor TaxID=166010 RepID=A0AAD4MN93_9BILA|nr:hypothetical protein DdX_16286 [Ditylenchus destructor]